MRRRMFKVMPSKTTSDFSAENAASKLERGNLSHSQRSRYSRHYATPTSWRACFYAALMADKMTICATAAMTPSRFLYGKDAI